MNVLLWYRRDLRITDHPALAQAAGQGAVLPLFIADPADWAGPERSARQWHFVQETLRGLSADLATLGLPLVLRRGDWREVLASLVRAYDLRQIVLHRGLSVQDAAQDRALLLWAAGRGVEVVLLDATQAVELPSVITPVADVAEGILPEARALGLAEDPAPLRPKGGRARALGLAQELLRRGVCGVHDRQRRCDPLQDLRLGPHIAWGSLCPQDLQRLWQANPGRDREMSAKDRQAFLRLADALAADVSTSDAGEIQLSQNPDLSAALRAWESGKIGWPFVDAANSALNQGVDLPISVLAHLANIAIHYGGCDVDAVLASLARRMTGYDPARFQPVRTAARASQADPLADPLRFGEKADPAGVFIRQWLPALCAVPEGFVHRPWEWMQGAAAPDYPAPLFALSAAKPRLARRVLRRPALPDCRQASFELTPPRVSTVAAETGRP